MAIDIELAPKQKRPAGEPCCEPVVYPDVERETADRMAVVAKALGDPVRLRILSRITSAPDGEICVCDITGGDLEVSGPTVSHHLKVLRQAGLVDSERRGLWAYYYVLPDALAEFSAWVAGPSQETCGC